TETLPALEVFHEVQTALRPLVAHLQTREQVDSLLQSLNAIGEQTTEQQARQTIHDPPAIRHKGRTRTSRLTNPLEGPPTGGGALALFSF
ncbi:hypothetical protein C8J57DRAFT_1095387, partial [Mycena rebaudengoi]